MTQTECSYHLSPLSTSHIPALPSPLPLCLCDIFSRVMIYRYIVTGAWNVIPSRRRLDGGDIRAITGRSLCAVGAIVGLPTQRCFFSPPENDSFQKDFCFMHDVFLFFLSSRDLRDAWADRREILHDGQ